MSSFYIGQRVRIARAKNPQFSGREATITSSLTVARLVSDPLTPKWGYDVSVAGIGNKDLNGLSLFAEPWQLEPILPSGLESIEEINALYEPQGVSA